MELKHDRKSSSSASQYCVQSSITRSDPVQQDDTFNWAGGIETAQTVPFKPEKSRLGMPAHGTVGVIVDVGAGMAEEFML